MPKFKTNDCYLLDNAHVFKVIDNNYNLPFILVQFSSTANRHIVNENLLINRPIKFLGTNFEAAQILYNVTERGNK
jgi:hypothetical protein